MNIEDILEVKDFNSKGFKIFYARKLSLLRLKQYIIGEFTQLQTDACFPGVMSSILKDSVLLETTLRCPENNWEIVRFILKDS